MMIFSLNAVSTAAPFRVPLGGLVRAAVAKTRKKRKREEEGEAAEGGRYKLNLKSTDETDGRE